MRRARLQRGSALVETALVVPCLILLLLWSGAITDAVILRLKACEAARYALWEATVFRDPAQVQSEVRARFADLRSPAAVQSSSTGLFLWPRAGDLDVRASLDTTTREAALGGRARVPSTSGLMGKFVDLAAGALGRSVDAALRAQRFNTHGVAEARVEIVRRSGRARFLAGGDLPGLRVAGGFEASRAILEPRFASPLPGQRPLTLVFDTWKAWPRPAAYATVPSPFDASVDPSKTYPVVEEQVAAQESAVAFGGVRRTAVGRAIARVTHTVHRFAQGYLLGGSLPDLFSTGRMDGPDGGFITILPPAPADASWVPRLCDFHGRTQPCANQRVGDVLAQTQARSLGGTQSVGDGVDRTRYTVPYRINTVPWTQSGGVEPEDTDDARLAPVSKEVAQRNASVRTYACRGHFFDGAVRGQSAGHRPAAGCDR